MNTFWRILSYCKPYKWQYVGILLLGIIAAALQPGAALAVKPLLAVLVGQDKSHVHVLPYLIVSFVFVTGLARYLYSIWSAYLSEVIIKKVRIQLYEKYMSLSLDHYASASTGKMMAVIQSDIVLLLEGLSRVTSLFRDPFTIMGLLAVSFYRDWKITLASLIVVPFLVFMISIIGRKLKNVTKHRQEQWASVTDIVHETLSGIRIIKAFNLEPYLKKKFREDNERLLKVQFRWIKIENISSPILHMVGGFGLALLTVYGGNQVLSAGVSGGDILSVGAALGLLIDPIKKINSLNLGFQKAFAGAERVFGVLDLKPSIEQAADAVSLVPLARDITFENVSFKYKGQEDWVLKDLSLRVPKGEVVALVGSSGAGKTTFVNLVPRFYDVVSGSICVDGLNIKDATLKSLRDQISIVSQDVFLFNESILDNISYGSALKSHDEIIEASKAANAHQFIIDELDEGYNTIVGERGVKLSGGQRQRISIARALLKNAPILILDEATSSLDTESEILVQRAIEKLMQGRTSFVIAHRLSTIQNASRILVLDQGQIAEEGTHDVLMDKQGMYFKYYQLQFSKQLGNAEQGAQKWQ